MKESKPSPPSLFLRFFRWFCNPELRKYIEGDLLELYSEGLKTKGKKRANIKFMIDVLLLFRPGIIKNFSGIESINNYAMFKSYLTIGWRNLLKNQGYSIINIGGLAIGMTVALFIGLWVYDEMSFNKYHKNYDAIAQVYSCGTDTETGVIGCGESVQYPVGTTLRSNFPQYFKHVLMAWGPGSHTLSSAERKLTRTGLFIEGGVLNMLSLKMLKGSYGSLDNPNSIVLSRSAAEAIFGDEDPLNKTLSIDNRMEVAVTGVYEDIPRNSRFSDIHFFSPWSLWLSVNEWAQRKEADWDNRPFNIYAQLQPDISMEAANAAINDLYAKNVPPDFFKAMERFKPFVQLVPMSTWHLYAELENGKPSAGRITYVWLFGTVGVFVLLLACINFINLSTARSEKRAREVGVRKTMGSAQRQLILQFLSESFMVVLVAFALSLVLLTLLHGWFNQLADKDIDLPFLNPTFWLIALGFIVITGIMAGTYPAFYLSAFHPVKVLKGVLNVGRLGTLPRKIMVVVQFTVSVVLIIGTIVIYQQIQFAQNRPVGYDRKGLIYIEMSDPNYSGKVEVMRTELLRTGAVIETATSSGPVTAIWNSTSGYDWPGKDPGLDAEFGICNVTRDFGRTVGWQIIAGRDFSKDFPSDSLDAIIVNEAAVKYMGMKDPVGQQFTDVDDLGRKKWSRTIIGVVKDLVMESPYNPVRQTLYFYNRNSFYGILQIRINPLVSARDALPKIEGVIKKLVPSALFDYKFVDEVHTRKFSQEERIGKLSGIFSILAIFISCLGLFGLSSYVAEQRTKEIGIRKVMGASVLQVWRLLSKDFVVLVIISCVVAIPLSFYFMDNWLMRYNYRVVLSWPIFVVAAMGALLITLLTVSFQAVKAALSNPVNSLRSE